MSGKVRVLAARAKKVEKGGSLFRIGMRGAHFLYGSLIPISNSVILFPYSVGWMAYHFFPSSTKKCANFAQFCIRLKQNSAESSWVATSIQIAKVFVLARVLQRIKCQALKTIWCEDVTHKKFIGELQMPNRIDQNTQRKDVEGKRTRTSNRGFASMDRTMQREIASRGGRAAHARGAAHEFTSEEAREAGRRGGRASSMSQGRGQNGRFAGRLKSVGTQENDQKHLSQDAAENASYYDEAPSRLPQEDDRYGRAS